MDLEVRDLITEGIQKNIILYSNVRSQIPLLLDS